MLFTLFFFFPQRVSTLSRREAHCCNLPKGVRRWATAIMRRSVRVLMEGRETEKEMAGKELHHTRFEKEAKAGKDRRKDPAREGPRISVHTMQVPFTTSFATKRNSTTILPSSLAAKRASRLFFASQTRSSLGWTVAAHNHEAHIRNVACACARAYHRLARSHACTHARTHETTHTHTHAHTPPSFDSFHPISQTLRQGRE